MHQSIPLVVLFAKKKKKLKNGKFSRLGTINKWVKCPRIRGRARTKVNTLHPGSSGK